MSDPAMPESPWTIEKKADAREPDSFMEGTDERYLLLSQEYVDKFAFLERSESLLMELAEAEDWQSGLRHRRKKQILEQLDHAKEFDSQGYMVAVLAEFANAVTTDTQAPHGQIIKQMEAIEAVEELMEDGTIPGLELFGTGNAGLDGKKVFSRNTLELWFLSLSSGTSVEELKQSQAAFNEKELEHYRIVRQSYESRQEYLDTLRDTDRLLGEVEELQEESHQLELKQSRDREEMAKKIATQRHQRMTNGR